MKFYFKKKAFSLDNNTLCIADEAGNKKYDLKTSIMITKTIRILDEDKQEVAVIKQELKSLMPKYAIYVDGEKIMTLTKKLQLFFEYVVGETDRWTIQCGTMIHNYEILKDGRVGARVSDKSMRWGDSFEIDILDEAEETMAVAIAVAAEYGIEAKSCLTQPI